MQKLSECDFNFPQVSDFVWLFNLIMKTQRWPLSINLFIGLSLRPCPILTVVRIFSANYFLITCSTYSYHNRQDRLRCLGQYRQQNNSNNQHHHRQDLLRWFRKCRRQSNPHNKIITHKSNFVVFASIIGIISKGNRTEWSPVQSVIVSIAEFLNMIVS